MSPHLWVLSNLKTNVPQTRESEGRALEPEHPLCCLNSFLTLLQRGGCCDSHDSPPPSAQSTNMAFGKVTEETVYTCTGHPLKSDIANILDWMLNQDFTTAYRSILPHVLRTAHDVPEARAWPRSPGRS